MDKRATVVGRGCEIGLRAQLTEHVDKIGSNRNGIAVLERALCRRHCQNYESRYDVIDDAILALVTLPKTLKML